MGNVLQKVKKRFWFRRRGRSRRTDRNRDARAAKEAVERFCNDMEEKIKDLKIKDLYKLGSSDHSTNIGGRLEKYWFFLTEQDQDPASANQRQTLEISDTHEQKLCHALLSISPVSASSPIIINTSTVKILRSIMTKVKELKHPFLHTVHGMWYLPDDDGGGKGHIIVIQDFHEVGSLRDYIHKEPPCSYEKKRTESLLKSWSGKYRVDKGMPIEVNEISMFGWHILQAIKFLYKSGFQTLGHVHVGNVFICEDEDGQKMCKLGGYDQTLLGYRPRLYRDILRMNLLEHIDVIMFGHVVFEMGSGTELSGVVPTQQEYDKVIDHDVRDVLHYIFDEHPNFKKIRKHGFFNKYAKIKIQCKLSSDEKAMLTAVHAPYAVKRNRRTKLSNLFSSSAAGNKFRRESGTRGNGIRFQSGKEESEAVKLLEEPTIN